MIYNQLGETDLHVSKISLGGANFGGLYETFDQAKVEQILSQAAKLGINFIDTAYWYGQGKSEERLGKALQKFPPNSFFIASKIGRYEKFQAGMFDFSAERTFRGVDECLTRLQMPCLDLIQIHDAEFAYSDRIILNETLPALEKVRLEGKTRYIGITGYDLDFMSSLIEKSRIKIDTVLVFGRANLHDDTLKNYIPKFQKHKVGVINASSLSMGMLTPQGPPSWHFAPKFLKEKCMQAVQYCKENNHDIVKLARQFSTNFSGIDTTLIGVDDVSELNTASLALDNLKKEEQTFLDHLREKFFITENDDHNWQEEFTIMKNGLHSQK